MAYIGNQPTDNFVTFATQNFSTSATSSYTLSHAVSNENEIALFINNVRQHPGSGKAYTASGTALTLSANTASTDVMYCIFLGRAIQSTVPATNSITAAMVSANAVTGAKLNTDVISAQTALAAEPADTDEFLVSDAGVLKRIDYSLIKGGGLKVADQWRLNSTYTVTSSSAALTNLEQVDTDGFGGIGTAMSASSGIFTFPSTGIYLITGSAYLYRENGGNPNVSLQLQTTTDNSSYNGAAIAAAIIENVSAYEANINLSFMFDVTNTTTHKCKFMANSSSGNIATMYAETAQNTTYFTFLKLGDT